MWEKNSKILLYFSHSVFLVLCLMFVYAEVDGRPVLCKVFLAMLACLQGRLLLLQQKLRASLKAHVVEGSLGGTQA